MPVTKTRSRWTSGVLEFIDASGNVIFGIDGPNRKAIFPSGSTLELSSGAVFTGTLLFDAADVAALAITEPKRGISVRNETGSTIAIDKLVAISGFDTTTGLPKIVLADADAGLPAVGVTVAAILTAASGTIATWALSTADLNTNSASSAGDPVYASGTAGGFSHTAPTGVNARTQIAGWVVVKSATVGQILWFPQQPYTVGTASYQALSVDAAALAADAVTTAKILDANVTAAKLEAGAAGAGLTGTQVKFLANANVIGGVPVLFEIAIADASADTDVVSTHKIQIDDFWFVGSGIGAHATTDTIQLKNGANAISDVIVKTATVEKVVRASTLVAAQRTIAAAGTIRITAAKTTNVAGTAYVLAHRVA